MRSLPSILLIILVTSVLLFDAILLFGYCTPPLVDF